MASIIKSWGKKAKFVGGVSDKQAIGQTNPRPLNCHKGICQCV